MEALQNHPCRKKPSLGRTPGVPWFPAEWGVGGRRGGVCIGPWDSKQKVDLEPDS